jgi:predicted small lipoprotein YifL
MAVKRLMMLVAVMLAIGLAGCGMKPGVNYKPDGPKPRPMYKNLDHLWFSIYGYKNQDPARQMEYANKTQEQNWWGEPIPYIPAE